MPIVYIALGSNLGNSVGIIKEALKIIDNFETTEIMKISKFYLTEPQGFVSDSLFVNAVAKIKTSLSLEDFFYKIEDTEKKLGRTRDNKSKNACYQSRLIDIDVIFYDNIILSSEILIVPHPKMHLRSFVIIPFLDIEPHFVHPKLGITIKQIKENLHLSDEDYDKCKEIENV